MIRRIASILAVAIGILHGQQLHAQASLEGRWRSADSSRKFTVVGKGNQQIAYLSASNREEDAIGRQVFEVVAHPRNSALYKGGMYAFDDGLVTKLRIRKSSDGKVLQLRLRRMFILPIHIKWYAD